MSDTHWMHLETNFQKHTSMSGVGQIYIKLFQTLLSNYVIFVKLYLVEAVEMQIDEQLCDHNHKC